MLRTELGFTRIICACRVCTLPCRHMPGMLIPSDIEPMSIACGELNPLDWAKKTLVASPGALVRGGGVEYRIKTLVPASREDGSCTFFEGDHCLIHPVAPFGCAFFDTHMGAAEGDERARASLIVIAKDWHVGGSYSALWNILNSMGRVVRRAEEARQEMREVMNKW